VRPSFVVTVTDCAFATTWRFVRIQPSESKMNPEPLPLPLPRMPPPWTSIVTTAGATAATASITALDSSIRTSLTAFATCDCSGAPSSVTGRGARFITANAESAPDRIPATTASATTANAPGPRPAGGSDAVTCSRLDHADAACQFGSLVGGSPDGP
jgi:hypothetical protein